FSLGKAQLNNFNNGDTAPDFTVTDVHGNTHTLYDATSAGKYVILDFFFTTCGPCQQRVPTFNEFYEKYGCNAGDVYLLSIDNGDTDQEVLAYEAQFAGGFMSVPSASGVNGGGNAVVSTYGPAAYPTFVLIGPDNKIINNDIWPMNAVADLEGAFPAGAITPMACSAVSVQAAAIENPITIYPQPASDIANLELNFGAAGFTMVQVYDLMGKRVMVETLGDLQAGEFKTQLNLSDLLSGTYTVVVTQDGKKVSTEKLSVMH
ncbi:MAG: redoxin domain-containing protein, partial [Bacteroidota bacterium]